MPRTKVSSGEAAAATHPKWDRKQGKPKSQEAEKVVEKAHGRYSGSDQGEDRKKAQERSPRRP
jgi:hypothetical protein